MNDIVLFFETENGVQKLKARLSDGRIIVLHEFDTIWEMVE